MNNSPKNCWHCPFNLETSDIQRCINPGKHADGTIPPDFRGPDAPLRPAWCPFVKEATIYIVEG